MRIEPITGKDKLGRTVVFRAAMPEDAGSRKRTGQVSVANLRIRKFEISMNAWRLWVSGALQGVW